MAEFFVYTCRQCGVAYPGALEATELRRNQIETNGLCVACLERLFGLTLADRSSERRTPDSGSASTKGDISLGE